MIQIIFGLSFFESISKMTFCPARFWKSFWIDAFILFFILKNSLNDLSLFLPWNVGTFNTKNLMVKREVNIVEVSQGCF